jgi:hypothetical protein
LTTLDLIDFIAMRPRNLDKLAFLYNRFVTCNRLAGPLGNTRAHLLSGLWGYRIADHRLKHSLSAAIGSL